MWWKFETFYKLRFIVKCPSSRLTTEVKQRRARMKPVWVTMESRRILAYQPCPGLVELNMGRWFKGLCIDCNSLVTLPS